MREGVANSKHFILVLTKSVLYRPYCLLEVYTAFELAKNVVLLKEADDRFAPFRFNDPLCLPKFSKTMSSEEYETVIEQIGKKNPSWSREEVEARLNGCIAARQSAVRGFSDCAGLSEEKAW
eukprot:CAMPEP_0201543616 /NCGR_PEP_ID=MMETSP0161_2-20130828/72701_1 /ASSEMBLY_ACC=CAM_ASM_000251 /TAXON_ID=180227 /ORGANISM="Neoparamoeba aestuarina, Strain SoJaBio B1-5/56/2" /LENGTH=121 /DNA_ID=CAMNT_0047951425 /DNA_START=287 /DNA_END=649 /DNA_ORIENTATION=-